MQAILDWLVGKKTYIVAIAGGLFNVAVQLGWIDASAEWLGVIDSIFIMLFGVALRAGVTKSGLK
jgi:hypothetical protein